jgi:acetyltransferase-like isoleucine patch superfamily enzyme
MIDACGFVEIGDHNMFGPGVYVTDSDHTVLPQRWVADCPMQVGRVVIGNGCWVGARSVILKNVALGDRCVVAAGAVVTKSFPARSVIMGIPARLVRTLPDE